MKPLSKLPLGPLFARRARSSLRRKRAAHLITI